MNVKRTLTITILLTTIFFLAACNGTPDGETVNQEETPEEVQVPEFSSVLAEGEVVPARFVNLSFQTGGIAAEVIVEEGDRVSAGDPLVLLDARDVQIQRDQAAARVTSAEAAVAAAVAQVAAAESRVASAQEQVTAAQAQLDLLLAGPRPEEILAAEKNLAAALASVVQAAGQRDSSLDVATDSAVEAARANVASAQAQLTQVESAYQNIIDLCFDTPDGEVCPLYGPVEEQTRAQLEAARENAAAAQAQLDALLNGPTAGQRQAAAGGVVLAEAQVAIAQAQLDLLLAGPTKEQVKQAEVAVQQAEANVRIAQAGVTQAQAGVIQAEAGLQTAQAAQQAAEAALSRMTLTAPFEGTVGRVNVNAGELVAPGASVLVFADLSSWTIRTTDLTELDVAKISPGSTVEVSFDAIPGETVTGTVTDVALVSSLSQGDVVYEVDVVLNDTGGLPIRWGMTTFIDVDAN